MQLNTQLDITMVAVDTDDTVTLLLDLQAPAEPATEQPRPEHTAVVVLDRSGSMAGGRLDAAKRALLDLVARLHDDDRFGLVVFDSVAEVITPAGRVHDVGRDRIRQDIANLDTRGMTDLASGYLRGLQESRRVCGPAGATVVLLSDGRANSGLRDPEKLRAVAGEAAGESVTTSSIGIGTDYDELILAAVAEGGRGNHSFAEHADAAAAAVAAELDGLLTKTVQAASLLIRPTGDVASVSILNDGLPSHRVEGGVQVELGDFSAGEQRKLVITLAVPALARLGLAQVADLSLTFVEMPALRQQTVTLPVSVNVVPADVAAGRVPNPVVERERLLQQTQTAKRVAEEALRRGDIDGAQRSLSAAKGRIDDAADDVRDEELLLEATWLAATQSSMEERDPMYNTKRLRSDSSRKGRGYKNRTQGGEVQPLDGGM